jgi:purine-binding chemotaxis protein CheW
MSKDAEILKHRSHFLAGSKLPQDDDLEYTLVVEFLLIPEKYALPASVISEVLPLKELTPVPGAPPFIIGMIKSRGQIISVINLKNLLKLQEKGITELNKVIVLQKDQVEFGILVDSIEGAREIPVNSIHPPPSTVSREGKAYIKGVTNEGLIILEPEAIFSSESLIIDQK